MINPDLTLALVFDTHSRYGSEKFQLKYNWKFSSNGGYTAKAGVRLVTWQFNLAVL